MSFEIETPRLNLRPLTAEDVDALHQLCTTAGVRKYLFDDSIAPREQIEAFWQTSRDLFASSGYGLWAMRLADERELIGFCGYWFFHDPPELELIYAISETLWGKGLVVEAAQTLMKYGFARLGFSRIQASTDAPNLASARVMEKLGMTFLKRGISDGLDTIYYSITREEFEEQFATT
jgi:[ribosomal protein S5]-alanine N-acetyltransferase